MRLWSKRAQSVIPDKSGRGSPQLQLWSPSMSGLQGARHERGKSMPFGIEAGPRDTTFRPVLRGAPRAAPSVTTLKKGAGVVRLL